MLLMGDEYGHTKGGNNNTWCHDSPINWFDWYAQDPLTDFLRKLITIRKQLLIPWLPIEWHGVKPNQPDWSSTSRFIAFMRGNLYIAINAYFEPLEIALPKGPWEMILATEAEATAPTDGHYTLAPYSSIMLQRTLL